MGGAAARRSVDHETSYRGLSPRAFLHRARLRAILKMLGRGVLPASGAVGDFGCSNGFILHELRRARLPHPEWELRGFDHAPHYVEAANARGIPGARFEPFDLDDAGARPPGKFDLVLCLETLEHTGRYRTALDNLARATRPGGLLLITVPNETGVPGVLKYFGRKILMGQSYEGFFRNRPRGPYVRALLTGGDLEIFRDPPRHGWADHLGFDLRRFEAALDERLVGPREFEMLSRRRNALGFGRTYLMRRRGRPPG